MNVRVLVRLLAVSIAVATPAWADEPTGRFMVGAGFSSDESFIAAAEIAQDDLFGTGHQLSLSAEVSALRQDARMRYVAPGIPERGYELSGELFARRRQYEGFTREGVGGALSAGRWLGRHTRVDVRYRAEHVAVDVDPAGAARGAAPEMAPLGDGMIATLGAGIVHDSLDARFVPTRGTRFELSAEVADPTVGSDYRFARATAALDHARPIGPLTLRLHGRAGYLRGLGGDAVPLSERFQHDGHADIRGYPLGSLGGLGGRELEVLGRIELEAPISRRLGLSVAAFADAGAGYNRDATWGPAGTTLDRSVGVSLIWRSPIGPLRFDWAFPLDGDDRSPQFLFGLGNVF